MVDFVYDSKKNVLTTTNNHRVVLWTDGQIYDLDIFEKSDDNMDWNVGFYSNGKIHNLMGDNPIDAPNFGLTEKIITITSERILDDEVPYDYSDAHTEKVSNSSFNETTSTKSDTTNSDTEETQDNSHFQPFSESDIIKFQESLSSETQSKLKQKDFGSDFLSGGTNLLSASSSVTDYTGAVLQVANGIVQDAESLPYTMALNASGQLMDSVMSVENYITDATQALMEVTQFMIDDTTDRANALVLQAVNDMLTIPTIGDVTTKSAKYLVKLTPSLNDAIRSVAVKVTTNQDNSIADATKVLGQGVSWINDQVGWVNSQVDWLMKQINDFTSNLMKNSDQGMEWIGKQIGMRENEILGFLEGVLYGYTKNYAKIQAYQSQIQKYQEQIQELKTKHNSLEKKTAQTDTKYASKIEKYNTKICKLQNKIQIESASTKTEKWTIEINQYQDQINNYEIKQGDTDLYKQQIESLNKKISKLEEKIKKGDKITQKKQEIEDEIAKYQGNGDLLEDVQWKSKMLLKEIQLDQRLLAQKGLVGKAQSLTNRIADWMALSIAKKQAEILAQTMITAQKKIKEETDKQTEKAKTKVKSNALCAILKVLTLLA